MIFDQVPPVPVRQVNELPSLKPAFPNLSPKAAGQASRNAAWTLALTLPGDTLLYLLLPLYAGSFGVSLPEAGLLLAANRLIRIFGYGWIARFYTDGGPRTACLMAAFGGALSTASYATLSGIWLLLIGRLVWGLSFGAMNIATQALAISVAEDAAARASQARAIVAIGPTIALLGGGVLTLYWGPRSVFVVLTLVACVAPIFALRIPHRMEPIAQREPRFTRPDPISVWAFCMGLTLDGLFMFGLGLLVAASYPEAAAFAAGAAMSLRYASEVFLSTTGGSLAERFGVRRTIISMSLVAALGLAILSGAGPWLWSGVVAALVMRAVAQPLAAPLVAESYSTLARISALTRVATWRDIGAGTGPLVAGLLLPLIPETIIYCGAAALLATASLLLMREVQNRSDAASSSGPGSIRRS
jgi:MFS family permease